MRNKIIAVLLILGSIGILSGCIFTMYRTFNIAGLNGSLITAIIGTLLSVGSLIFAFKSLGEAGEDAERNVKEINFFKPVASVVIAFISSLYAIDSAGLSVSDYLSWLSGFVT
jgi:hypothetical protein